MVDSIQNIGVVVATLISLAILAKKRHANLILQEFQCAIAWNAKQDLAFLSKTKGTLVHNAV